MFQSAVIYLSLMIIMILLGSFQERINLNPDRNIPFLYMFIPCLVFAFVFGCRYNVGTDHLRYLSVYLSGGDRELESGFTFIENVFRGLGLHFACFFSFCAFFQISFYVAAFKDRRLYPWIVLTLFLGCQWLGWCNGIRQAMAACVFVYSIQFIENKQFIPYLICILVASLFHRSALILFPFFFIRYFDFYRIKWIPWVIYLLSLVLSSRSEINDFVLAYFDPIADFLGYGDVYSSDSAIESLSFSDSDSSGLGVYLSVLTSLFILYYIPIAKRYFNTKQFDIISDLFLIGLIGSTLFPGQVVLVRPFSFFTIFRVVIIAFLLFFLFQEKSITRRISGIFLLSLIALHFLAIIYRGSINSAEFHFFWEYINI